MAKLDLAADGKPPRPYKFEWTDQIRRLPIKPPIRKLVALTLSTYANGDGSHAHPGEARLAADCGIKPRSVREHLAVLRDELGVIQRVYRGSSAGRRRAADEYQLTMPDDVVKRLRISCTVCFDRTDSPCDHRHPETGDPVSTITGTTVPVIEREEPTTGTPTPEHRHPQTDHRHHGAKTTGTTVPPTNQVTTEVEQPSTSAEITEATSLTDQAYADARKTISAHPQLADQAYAFASEFLADDDAPIQQLIITAAQWIQEHRHNRSAATA